MYLQNHCVSVDWNPSHTDMAKQSGPRMDRTMRKNVLSTSMTSAAAWNSSSSSSRKKSRMLFFMLYMPRSTYIPAIVTTSPGDQPSSSSCLSNSSLLTRYAVSGLRFIASYSSLSFCARYSFMSKVCVSNMECVPCTMGLITLLSVPSTMVGKNMMASPMANGRSSGNTSIGSALDSDCQTLRAT